MLDWHPCLPAFLPACACLLAFFCSGRGGWDRYEHSQTGDTRRHFGSQGSLAALEDSYFSCSAGSGCFLLSYPEGVRDLFFFVDSKHFRMASVSAIKVPAPAVVAEKSLDSNMYALGSFVGMSGAQLANFASLLDMPTDIEVLKTISPRCFMGMAEDAVDAVISTMEGGLYAKSLAKQVFLIGRKLHSEDPPPVATASPAVTTLSTSIASSQNPGDIVLGGARKVKLGTVYDPMDDTEVTAATPSMLKQWYAQYRLVKKGAPLVGKEPTPDQILALHTRIIVHGLEPYADYSVLTPNGRRMAKRLKFMNWVPQPDGSYQHVEVPGPSSFELWEKCHAVWEVIMLMLTYPPKTPEEEAKPVFTLIAAETYFEAFKELAQQHPECWHLCCQAEDRCRAEHIPRLARDIEAETGIFPDWADVFIKAALDDRYWDRHVRRPALVFLARNKRVPESFDEDLPTVPSAHPAGRPSKKQRKEQARAKAQATERVKLVPNNDYVTAKGTPKGNGKGKGPHPRKTSQGFVSTREGAQICFRFAKGPEGACPSPCPDGRAHVCQKCLQPHRNNSESCRGNV